MKKVAITFLLTLIIAISNAQEHLRFLDVPIGGSLNEFTNKLVRNKGLKQVQMTEGDEYVGYESCKLVGNYMNFKDAIIYVHKHHQLETVSSVTVSFDSLSFNAYNIDQAKRLMNEYDEKYGKHKSDSLVLVCKRYRWVLDNGHIELRFFQSSFNISYTDYSEYQVKELKPMYDGEIDYSFVNSVNKMIQDEKEWKEKQKVKEICGIQFGTSYEKTKRMLENKYGLPDYNPDKTHIVYTNKSYAGISFNSIHFFFQSDGLNSYFNGCIFVLEANSLREAEQKCKLLYNKLSEKYIIVSDKDSDGNVYYYGGISPIPDDEKTAFAIDILKYNIRNSVPYAARLVYGRYNYVKEDF